MKRKIDFIGSKRNGLPLAKRVTVKLGKFKTTKLRQEIPFAGTYVIVTVSMDRWGRLNAVTIGRSNHES